MELSKAVSVALNKTCEKDTLIVVTSDHAHTMSMSGFPVSTTYFDPLLNTKTCAFYSLEEMISLA